MTKANHHRKRNEMRSTLSGHTLSIKWRGKQKRGGGGGGGGSLCIPLIKLFSQNLRYFTIKWQQPQCAC